MAHKGTKPQPPQQPPPPTPARHRSILPFAGIIVVLAIVAGYHWYERLAGPSADQSTVSTTPASAEAPPSQSDARETSAAAAPSSSEVPASAKFGPHKQDNYPQLPNTGFPPPRPMETVQAVYRFAAEHPEVLSYIPCYCGCDRQGHKGNDDCFVAERDPKGDVVAWDQHGIT